MKTTETSPFAHVLTKSQPEEFDLVILGGGTGLDGTFPILAPEIRERSVRPPNFSPAPWVLLAILFFVFLLLLFTCPSGDRRTGLQERLSIFVKTFKMRSK